MRDRQRIKRNVKEQIQNQLDEYQRITKWVQEANQIYSSRFRLPRIEIKFTDADYFEAQNLKMTAEQFVLSVLQEKQSEMDYESDLQYDGVCSYCGLSGCYGECCAVSCPYCENYDCYGECREDSYCCSVCGSLHCNGRSELGK